MRAGGVLGNLKRILILSLLLTLGAGVGLVKAEPTASAVSMFKPSEWEKLQKGTVLITESKGNPHREVIARVLVKRPMNQIWPVLSDPKKMFSGDPRVKKVDVLEHPTPSRDLVAYAMVLSPMLPKFEYVTQIDYTKPHRVHFKRVSGNLKDFESECRLQALDKNLTLATYSMYVDFGMFVPQFVIRQFIKNDMPSMVTRVVQRIYQTAPR